MTETRKKTCIGVTLALLASMLAVLPASANTSSDDNSAPGAPNALDNDWCTAVMDPQIGYQGDSNSCDDDAVVMSMQNLGGYDIVLTNSGACDATGDVCAKGFEGFMDSTTNVDNTGRYTFGDDHPIVETVTITVAPAAIFRVFYDVRSTTTGAITGNNVIATNLATDVSTLWTDVRCIGTLTITVPMGSTIDNVVGARVIDSAPGCPATNTLPRTVTITPTYTYTDLDNAPGLIADATVGFGGPWTNVGGTCTNTYTATATTFDAALWSRTEAFLGVNGLIVTSDSDSAAGPQTATVGGPITLNSGDTAVLWASASQIGDHGAEARLVFTCPPTPPPAPCDPTVGFCPCPAPFTGMYTVPPGPTTCVPPSAPLECFDGVDNDFDGGTDVNGSPPDAQCVACPIGTEASSAACNTGIPLPGCIDGMFGGNPDSDGNGDGEFGGTDPECDVLQGGAPFNNEDGTLPYLSLECFDSIDNDGDDTSTAGGVDIDGFGSMQSPPESDPNCDIFKGGFPLAREDGTA